MKHLSSGAGGSDGKESACSARDWGLIPELGRSPGEGNGYPCSSILAWRTPWTEEPGRRQSLGSQRVGHSSVSNTLSCFQVLSFKNKAYLKQKEKKKVKSKRIFKKSTFPSLKKFHEFHYGAPLTQAPTLLGATTQRELGLTQETYKNALPSCYPKMPRSPFSAHSCSDHP